MLYLGMRDNPQGLTRAQMIRICFQQHGVSEGSGLTDDQFAAMVYDPNYHASTPEGILCYQDPTGSRGLTVEEAQAEDATREPISTPPPCTPLPDGSCMTVVTHTPG